MYSSNIISYHQSYDMIKISRIHSHVNSVGYINK